TSVCALPGFKCLHRYALPEGRRKPARLWHTLLSEPDWILRDEPFGALDAQTKLKMQEWLTQLWSDFNKTVLFVTHDVEEASYLSDEVHVMATRPGRIIATIPVPLARPRIRGSVLTGEFLSIKERCLQLLHIEGTATAPINVA